MNLNKKDIVAFLLLVMAMAGYAAVSLHEQVPQSFPHHHGQKRQCHGEKNL